MRKSVRSNENNRTTVQTKCRRFLTGCLSELFFSPECDFVNNMAVGCVIMCERAVRCSVLIVALYL